jgi:steroid delta-isomerase-like uncharacterized protein
MSGTDLVALDDRRLAAWNAHDTDAWVACFAPSFEYHDWSLPEPIRDEPALRAAFEGWIAALPDMTISIVRRVVGDDAVAAEIAFTGTNAGPMRSGDGSIPATGRTVHGRGSYIARFEDGKVVELRAHPDVAGMMSQLGLWAPGG